MTYPPNANAEQEDTELDNEMVDFRSLLLQLHTETLKTNRDISGYLFIIMHALLTIVAILIGILVSGEFSK